MGTARLIFVFGSQLSPSIVLARTRINPNGLMSQSMGLIKGSPDLSHAAHFGQPTMTDPKKTLPASIPVVNNEQTAPAAGSGTTDVTAQPATSGALETKPDARTGEGGAPLAAAKAPAAADAPLPTNRDAQMAKYRAMQAKKQAQLEKKSKKKKTDTAAPATSTPAATTTPASTDTPKTSDTPAKPQQ